MKIAFTGAHGTGKTTLTNAVLTELSKRGSVTASREVPRVIINMASDDEFFRRGNNSPLRQLIILVYQLIEDDEKRREAEIVVCDRTLIDHIAYTTVQFRDVFSKVELDVIMSAAKRWLQTYDAIFYLPIEFRVQDDGVREGDTAFQREIDEEITLLYRQLGVEPVILRGTVAERVATVVSCLS
jgi:predicted ATPase